MFIRQGSRLKRRVWATARPLVAHVRGAPATSVVGLPMLPYVCFCVLQKYVSPILMGYLSGFIQNLPDLKLSMWQGNVVLKNLQIKVGRCSSLPVPSDNRVWLCRRAPLRTCCRFASLAVGSRSCILPFLGPASPPRLFRYGPSEYWLALLTCNAQVWLKRVDINVAFGDSKPARRQSGANTPAPGAEDNPFAPPAAPAPEEAAASTDGGWTGSIAAKIINNVEIKAESVTVRIFDTQSEDSATLSMGIAHLYSCDAAFGARLFNDPAGLDFMRKMCRVEDVSLEVASGMSESTSAEAIFSGVSATVRLEKVGNLRNLRLSPPDAPTTRIDVRLTDVAAQMEPHQFAFLLKAIFGLVGEGDGTSDPVEAALRKAPVVVPQHSSPSKAPASPRAFAVAPPPPLVPPTGQLIDIPTDAKPSPNPKAANGGSWVGWLLGGQSQQQAGAAAGGAQHNASSDLLSFGEPAQTDLAAESGPAKLAVASTAFGLFVQHLSVKLVSKGRPPIILRVVSAAVEVASDDVIVAFDSATGMFGEQNVLSIRGSFPATAAAPVEQWAFELFASQKGEGSRSVGLDASVRLFRPGSLFDPNGFRISAAAGIVLPGENSKKDEDASYIVGEFGVLEHTPRKAGRFVNEKPNFRASGRQAEWQRGCHVTALAWHSFEGVLMRLGGPVHVTSSNASEPEWERFANRPIHQTLSVCVDYVHATVLPDLLATVHEFIGAAFKPEFKGAAAHGPDHGLGAFAPDFDTLLDRFLSRVWRSPPVSVEARVNTGMAVIQSDVRGFPHAVIRASKVHVSDNMTGRCFPGADFVSLCRSYKLNPRFTAQMNKEDLMRYCAQNWSIAAHGASVVMGDTAIVSASGALTVRLAMSRSSRLWDHFSAAIDLSGSFSAAFSPQHLSFFAHCLNVFTGEAAKRKVPVIPYPRDVVHMTGSDFSLLLSPDVVKAGLTVASLHRDGFGPVLGPVAGARGAVFALTLGNPRLAHHSTLSQGFWRDPVVEVVLHSALVRLDYEVLFGWLLDGLQLVDHGLADVLHNVVLPRSSGVATAVPAVPYSVYEMLTWKWSLSLKDVELHLRSNYALMIPSLEMRPVSVVEADTKQQQQIMALRGVKLGSLFGEDGLEMDVKVVCGGGNVPSLSLSMVWNMPWVGRISTREIEELLAVVDDVMAHLDGRKRYTHCWGEAILVAAAAPVLPVAVTQPQWVDFGATVSVASVSLNLVLGQNAQVSCKFKAISGTYGHAVHSQDLVLAGNGFEVTMRTEEKQHLFVSCSRFLMSDCTVKRDRSFKLEVFGLVADRLDNVTAAGVAESADTILRTMDVLAVRVVENKTASQMISFDKPVVPVVTATMSPCQIKLDQQTVAAVKSLILSFSAIRTPAPTTASRSVVSSRSSSARALSPSPAPVDDNVAVGASLAFQIQLQSLTLWFASPAGRVSSRLVWSEIVVSFSPLEAAFTVKLFSWKTESGRMLVSSAPDLPFVHLSAATGADAMLDVASLNGKIGSDVLESVMCVLQAGGATPASAAAVVVSDQIPLPVPSPFPAFLSSYARVKVLVAPFKVAVVARNAAEVEIAFDQIFFSSNLVDTVFAQHAGSMTLVDLRVRSNVSHECLLEALTLMAEVSLSPVYVEITASVTHPLRAHVRPSDFALVEVLLKEIFPLDAALRGEVALAAVPTAAPANAVQLLDAMQVQAAFTGVTDILSSLALVGNADGRRPETGECVLGLESLAGRTVGSRRQPTSVRHGVMSFVSWKLRTPHALSVVFQRHSVPMPEPNCVAVVQVQHWDPHSAQYVTSGSLLLSSRDDGFESNRCTFPVSLSAVRQTEWRLVCEVRTTSGAPLSAKNAVISPQLLFSALGIDGAWVFGESCISLSVPKATLYLSHSYSRHADGQAEEEEVLVLNLSGLRLGHSSGDARSSLAVTAGLKCVQFDELTLVDVVEPFSMLALHSRAMWDVHLSRMSVNASPLLCGTVSKYAALWTTAVEGDVGGSEFEFAHYILHNICIVPLVVGQEQTSESLTLLPQTRTKYSWQSGLGAPRVLQVGLLDGKERLALNLDSVLSDDLSSMELQVELGPFCICMKVERPSPSMRCSREVTFLGSYLLHSALHSQVTVRLSLNVPTGKNQDQLVVVQPGMSVGLVMSPDSALHTTASLTMTHNNATVAYPSSLVLKLGEGSFRTLMEAPGTDLRFWACQVGNRLSLIPALSVWNCSPCPLTFCCGPTVKTLQPGCSSAVEKLNLSSAQLKCSLDGVAWSPEYPITMDGLLTASEVPQCKELRCGNHTLFLSVHSDKMYGGVVAVLHSQFSVRNETLHNLQLYAGATPKLPQERLVVLPSLQPSVFTVPAMSLLMLPWDAQASEVSFRLASSRALDDWNDVADDGGKGRDLTLRGERIDGKPDDGAQAEGEHFRYPLVAQFQKLDPVPGHVNPGKALLLSARLVVSPKMILHSKLDIPMLVRVGCGRPDHERCLSGLSFEMQPRAQRELSGFRFGFHISVSFDGGSNWSDQILVGKDMVRSPVALLRSGPPMLLCYSVVAAPNNALHTTIMLDTTPPLCVRNNCSFDVNIATLRSEPIFIEAGACVSVPPQVDGATKLILSQPVKMGPRSAPVLVESDGDGHVKLLETLVYFRISSVMGSRLVRLAEVAFPPVPPVVSTGVLTRLIVGVEELSLSLFDEKAEAECVRLTVANLTVDFGQRCNPNVYSPVKVLTDLSVSTGSIQLDNHTDEAGEFPVVLVSTALVKREAIGGAKALLHVRTSFGFCDEGLHVDECIVALQPISCFVGEAFVLYAQRQLDMLIAAVRPPQRAANKTVALASMERFDAVDGRHADIDALVESETTTPPFIHYLKLSAIEVRMTLHFNVERVHLYLGMDNSPVAVSEVVMNDASIRVADLLSNLVSLYVADMVIRSPSLLGSLQILGNPTSFVGSVIDGVYDLLVMPMRGVRDLNAVGTVLGFGRGSASFMRHLSVGTLRSFSGWFGSVSKNMDMLTLDEAYVLRHIRERTLASRAGLGASLVSGMTGLGSSILEGVVGVVVQPMRGAQANGLRGFLAGSAMGAVNVLLKPLGGAMELVSRASQGALVSAGGGPYGDRCAPAGKRRTRSVNADVKWRRKVPEFVRAFECSETRYASCVVLLTANAAMLVVDDVVKETIDLREPFAYQETFATGAAKFTVGTWSLALQQQRERREFSRFFKTRK